MSLPDEIASRAHPASRDILTSRKLLTAPYPSTWIRHQWLIPWDYQGTHTPSIKRLDRWVRAEQLAALGRLRGQHHRRWQFVILFER